jgi:hypothetical protein
MTPMKLWKGSTTWLKVSYLTTMKGSERTAQFTEECYVLPKRPLVIFK